MTYLPDEYLSSRLNRLQSVISNLNRAANLDGLLVVLMNSQSQMPIEPAVYVAPSEWLKPNRDRLRMAPSIALLGCLLAWQARQGEQLNADASVAFIESLRSLQQRQDVFQTPNSWILQPDILIGIAFGVRALKDDDGKKWYVSLLKQGAARTNITVLVKLVYVYCLALLEVQAKPDHIALLPHDLAQLSLAELSLFILLMRRTVPADSSYHTQLTQIQDIFLREFVTGEPYSTEDFKAGLIWFVAQSCFEYRSVLTPSMELVIRLLTGFPAGMERWKSKWPIADESDIQSLLWLILKPYFRDLKYEENLPKFGRSGHRYDFAIPQLGLLIEVKYIRRERDFQTIVEEIGQDVAQVQIQTSFTGIVAFIFDNTCSSERYNWVCESLTQLTLIKDVVVVGAPSTVRTKATQISKSK